MTTSLYIRQALTLESYFEQLDPEGHHFVWSFSFLFFVEMPNREKWRKRPERPSQRDYLKTTSRLNYPISDEILQDGHFLRLHVYNVEPRAKTETQMKVVAIFVRLDNGERFRCSIHHKVVLLLKFTDVDVRWTDFFRHRRCFARTCPFIDRYTLSNGNC